jgi:hypothetical protein
MWAPTLASGSIANQFPDHADLAVHYTPAVDPDQTDVGDVVAIGVRPVHADPYLDGILEPSCGNGDGGHSEHVVHHLHVAVRAIANVEERLRPGTVWPGGRRAQPPGNAIENATPRVTAAVDAGAHCLPGMKRGNR